MVAVLEHPRELREQGRGGRSAAVTVRNSRCGEVVQHRARTTRALREPGQAPGFGEITAQPAPKLGHGSVEHRCGLAQETQVRRHLLELFHPRACGALGLDEPISGLDRLDGTRATNRNQGFPRAFECFDRRE